MSSASQARLGTWSAVSLLLGNVVGVGIFLTPAEVAAACPDLSAYFGLWLLGALVSVAGALSLAELGVMLPRSGGDYVYLRRAFGPVVARAWGMMAVFGTFCGSIAALAVGTVETIASTELGGALHHVALSLGGVDVTWGQLGGVLVVGAVTLANARPAAHVGRLQLLVTAVPVSLYLAVGVWALLQAAPAAPIAVTPAPEPGSSPGLAAAFGAVFFTYSGWNILTYVGGEIREPARTVPRAVVIGLAVTFLLYLVLNLLFVRWIPLEVLAHTPNAGVAVAERLFGATGATVVGVALALAILAGLNATVMAGSRIVVAMARAGHLPRGLGFMRDGQAPLRALAVQGGWSAALVLTGSFGWLVAMTGTVMFLLSCLTVAALFVLRRRGLPSAYRTPGFPLPPALYIGCGVMLVVAECLESLSLLASGVGIFALLVAISAWMRRRSSPPAPEPIP